jgi:flagellar FliL protein
MSENIEEVPAVSAVPAAPAKKSKLLLIIILVVVLAIGGGATWFFFLSSDEDAEEESTSDESEHEEEKPKKKAKKATLKEKHEEDEEEHGEDEEDDEEEEHVEPSKVSKEGIANAKAVSLLVPKDKEVTKIVELQPFVLNLADKDENRFLRLTLSLGLGTEGEEEEKPDPLFITRARNALLAVLMTKTSSDVLTIEGKVILRKEMLRAVQRASKEPHVKALYITELIVQK